MKPPIERSGPFIHNDPSGARLPADFTLLQVTPALDAGGVESLTLVTAAAAARAGARSLVASHGGRLESALTAGGGELIRMPLNARNPIAIAANAVRLNAAARAERVSLIHVRSRAPAFSAIAAGRRRGIPVVTSYHGVYAARSALKRMYNSVMIRGDAVIANSAFTAAHIRATYPEAADRIAVIPEGVDAAVFDPAAISEARVAAARGALCVAAGESRAVVLVAARLTALKGHELLIDAAARTARRRDVILVFAGAGEASPLAARLCERARAAGVELRVAGEVADMPAAFLVADLVAAPSLVPETFGRGVAEAAAMGRVVLASDIGGQSETLVDGEGGRLVSAGDTAAWAEALDRALAMTMAERAVMGAAARARVAARHSVAAMCAATFDLYQRLVGQ